MKRSHINKVLFTFIIFIILSALFLPLITAEDQEIPINPPSGGQATTTPKPAVPAGTASGQSTSDWFKQGIEDLKKLFIKDPGAKSGAKDKGFLGTIALAFYTFTGFGPVTGDQQFRDIIILVIVCAIIYIWGKINRNSLEAGIKVDASKVWLSMNIFKAFIISMVIYLISANVISAPIVYLRWIFFPLFAITGEIINLIPYGDWITPILRTVLTLYEFLLVGKIIFIISIPIQKAVAVEEQAGRQRKMQRGVERIEAAGESEDR